MTVDDHATSFVLDYRRLLYSTPARPLQDLTLITETLLLPTTGHNLARVHPYQDVKVDVAEERTHPDRAACTRGQRRVRRLWSPPAAMGELEPGHLAVCQVCCESCHGLLFLTWARLGRVGCLSIRR